MKRQDKIEHAHRRGVELPLALWLSLWDVWVYSEGEWLDDTGDQ